MIVIRHAEIFTKSPPVQNYFITRLVHNIKTALPKAKIARKHWRIYVDTKNEKPAVEKLKRVFGVASISIAERCRADIKEIRSLTKKIKVKGTFAVRTQRLSKSFPMNSQEVNISVAEDIDHPVDLKNPDTEIFVEIYDNYAYVFAKTISGPGGLPLGTAGNATILLKNKNDVLAGLMMMKRGIKPRYLGKSQLVKKLLPWCSGCNLRKAEKHLGWAVISGATDFTEFKKTQKKYEMPLFAPLIGLSKKQLKEFREKFEL